MHLVHNTLYDKIHPPELPTSMIVGRSQPLLNEPNIKTEESSTQTQSGMGIENVSTPTKSSEMMVEPPTSSSQQNQINQIKEQLHALETFLHTSTSNRTSQPNNRTLQLNDHTSQPNNRTLHLDYRTPQLNFCTTQPPTLPPLPTAQQ